MEARALAAGTALNMSRPERDADGPLNLIRESTKRPPLISERSSWGDARPAGRGREMSGDRYSVGGLKVDDYFGPWTIDRGPNRGPFKARVKVND